MFNEVNQRTDLTTAWFFLCEIPRIETKSEMRETVGSREMDLSGGEGEQEMEEGLWGRGGVKRERSCVMHAHQLCRCVIIMGCMHRLILNKQNPQRKASGAPPGVN